MRMYADTGVDVGVTQGEVNTGAGAFKVATDRQNVTDTIIAGTFDDCVQIGIIGLGLVLPLIVSIRGS